jgi:hypothetical protein
LGWLAGRVNKVTFGFYIHRYILSRSIRQASLGNNPQNSPFYFFPATTTTTTTNMAKERTKDKSSKGQEGQEGKAQQRRHSANLRPSLSHLEKKI